MNPGATRVLCVAGSPRRRGASELLLDACIQGVERGGATADKLVVVEHAIRPCQGCNACSKTGRCRLDDAMNELYRRVDAADAIIVSSPVFFASVPAVLKAFYDRMQPYWARVYALGESKPARRPGGMLFVRGGGDPFGFEGAVMTTRSVFAVLGLDVLGEVLVDDVDNASELVKHPDALRLAEELGEAIAVEADRRREINGP